jgi:hypothetical protein
MNLVQIVRSVALPVVTIAAAAASALSDGPADPGIVLGLRPGQWELRGRTEVTVRRVCVKEGTSLIQLRHPGKVCERIVLERTPNSIEVQYTCKGSGFGRTHIRRETPQLIQLESQGVADGLPFEHSAEGRWVGECS